MAKLTPNQAAYQALLEKYSKSRIAEMAGTSRQALTKWHIVPIARVQAIAKETGIKPEELLPEPYSTT
jgi:hypothetical protein